MANFRKISTKFSTDFRPFLLAHRFCSNHDPNFRGSPASVKRGLPESMREKWVPSDPEEEEKQRNLSPRERKLQKEQKEIKEWRSRGGAYPNDKSMLAAFNFSKNQSPYLEYMQRPFDYSIMGIKKWASEKKEDYERHMQQYVEKRHSVLGPDLATAHFVLYRGGQVKFFGSDEWMKAREKEFDLPTIFNPNYIVEALICDNMLLYYEGIENIRDLKRLRFLSMRNVTTFDDWCMDRICGARLSALETLDLTGTSITYRCLAAVYKMPSLRLLYVNDVGKDIEWKLSLALLNEVMPDLEVKSGKSPMEQDESERLLRK